jgi:hypothetical protein
MSNNDKAINQIPKFDKLSYGTLRRYQAFFNIKDEKKSLNKNDIVKLVKNHFVNLELDSDRVLESFMKIEKDQNSDKNNALRKSTRFQEKNMTKFLDNFTNLK